MKNKISKNLLLRLNAQAEEAEVYGDVKTAVGLTGLILKFAEENRIRDEEEEKEYVYTNEELAESVRTLIYEAVLRVFDYYDSLPDARIIENLVDDLTNIVCSSSENLVDGVHVGKYEPDVLGEKEEDRIVNEEDFMWKVELEDEEKEEDETEEDEDEEIEDEDEIEEDEETEEDVEEVEFEGNDEDDEDDEDDDEDDEDDENKH